MDVFVSLAEVWVAINRSLLARVCTSIFQKAVSLHNIFPSLFALLVFAKATITIIIARTQFFSKEKSKAFVLQYKNILLNMQK